MWLGNGYASSNTVDSSPNFKSLWAMDIKGTLMFKLLKLFITTYKIYLNKIVLFYIL